MEGQQSRTIRYKLVSEQRVLLPRCSLRMFIRLIIQNRFHLLLKNFSIWNSLSDVLSAPLFVATISIHLCCLPRWISSRQFFAPEDFSVSNLPLRRLTIRRSCVCCSVCMRNGLRFTDSKHCFADDENKAVHECFGHWWEFENCFQSNVA